MMYFDDVLFDRDNEYQLVPWYPRHFWSYLKQIRKSCVFFQKKKYFQISYLRSFQLAGVLVTFTQFFDFLATRCVSKSFFRVSHGDRIWVPLRFRSLTSSALSFLGSSYTLATWKFRPPYEITDVLDEVGRKKKIHQLLPRPGAVQPKPPVDRRWNFNTVW